MNLISIWSRAVLVPSLLILSAASRLPVVGSAAVMVREETIVLPTYQAGEPERNPMFYFGRASQGAEGRVYPYPLHDTLTWEKGGRPYRLIHRENEHVRIAVLPEIGGRLFEVIPRDPRAPYYLGNLLFDWQPAQAAQAWNEAAATLAATAPGSVTPPSSRGVQRYYQARALERLGQPTATGEIYRDLLATARGAPERETARIDFFASLIARTVLAAVETGRVEPAGQLVPEEVASPFRVVSYNLWDGFQVKPEPRRERWLEWMAEQQPDVAALQELNGYTPERLAAEARGWGHGYSVLLKEDGHPTALTSRTPITEVKRIREGMHHGLLRGKIRGVYFYVIHFHPSNYERRIEEAGLLLDETARLPEPDPRVVLIGDFNGFSPADRFHYETDPELEPFFAMLDERHPGAKNLNAGRLDYGGIERILEAGYLDLVARFRPPNAFVGTFPTELRREEDHGTDRRIDYVFVSANLVASARSAAILRDDTTALLSDHYPLMAEFDLP